MTQEEFAIGFDKLTQAFNVPKPESKAKIYFQELKDMSGDLFAECVHRCVRQNDRFPSISAILTLADIIHPRMEDRPIWVKCTKCDGYGWVFFMKRAFRARCEHSKGLSEKIAYAPESEINFMNWKNKFKQEDNLIYGLTTKPMDDFMVNK